MRHKRPFRVDTPPFWQPEAAASDPGADVELEPVRRGPTEADSTGGSPGRRDDEGSRRPGTGTPWSPAGGPVVLDDADGQRLQRVGGHRKVRRDFVALGVGVAFLAAALLKPWNALIAPADPPGQPSPRAGQADVLTPSASPSLPAPDATTAAGPGLAPDAAAVDWTTVVSGDPHAAWGVATAVLPGLGVPTAIVPKLHWVPSGSPPASPLALTAASYQRIYAIAITWPSSVHVLDVGFEYLGSNGSWSYDSQRVPPLTQFQAIPADLILAPNAAGLSPAIPSGRFWFAPIGLTSSGDWPYVPSAWLSQPRPWPSGDYRVTLTLERSSLVLALRLER